MLVYNLLLIRCNEAYIEKILVADCVKDIAAFGLNFAGYAAVEVMLNLFSPNFKKLWVIIL